MKKFEYKVLVVHWENQASIKDIEQTLNEEGKQGWELITSNRDEYPSNVKNGEQVMLIFKKQIK
jgi:predicted Rossmann fold nucleotide-binding protein DprA/Smf involved in DNA uptake